MLRTVYGSATEAEVAAPFQDLRVLDSVILDGTQLEYILRAALLLLADWHRGNNLAVARVVVLG